MFFPTFFGHGIGGDFLVADLLGSLTTHTRSHNQMGQHHFLLGHLSDTLLDRRARHESIDHDLVGLTDTMSARERLNVVVWIPIRVVDDDRVGGSQVNAQTTGSGRQQEAELLRARCVESIDRILTLRTRDGSVDTFVFISFKKELFYEFKVYFWLMFGLFVNVI